MLNKFFIILLTLNSIFVLYSQSIDKEIERILQNDFFQSTIISADIYDLTSEEYLYRLNETLLLHPASNMKLFTSIAGLLFLGPEYQFITSLYYDGEIVGNTLFGNLYIEGGCDPELETEKLMEFVRALKVLNIRSISGNIYADITFKDSLYWGTGWMWDDDPSTDAPYMSALNINNNSVSITLSGTNVGQPAEILLNPPTSFFSVINNTTTVLGKNDEDFSITRNWFERKNEIIATGRVSLEKTIENENGDKQVNVINPEFYFLTLFKELLISNGISVSGQLSVTDLPLINKFITTIPTSITEVLKNVNKESNNLSAEMILYALAEKFYGRPATAENGIKVIHDLINLLGHFSENYKFVDGSGVSHYNLVSAQLITDMLKYIYTNEKEVYKYLLETLPIAGIDGTLEKRMTNSKASNNVRAKTGTLSGVNALSGFVTAANGNEIVFSILIQNHVNKSAKAREFQDRISEILAEYQ
jgi:D-alanyl-D-alanine carboxypeptidase/D-alanyl-D-alanine-endopeptidase (penicillin-binding protein 4)